MSISKVLVTGGSGFIGRQIVQELTRRGLEVISFDVVPPLKRSNGVQYVAGTILDEYTLGRHLRACDAVIHLAGVLGVRRADLDLLSCLNINILGTQKVLSAALMNGVGRIVFSSSSEVFGDSSTGRVNESSALQPKSGYAISKLAAEQFIHGFSREFGLTYTIVRFFNIYGPGQSVEFVVPRFCHQACNGSELLVYGAGTQIRSFCYIDDAALATVDLLLNPNSGNETFNVGNDKEPIEMRKLASKVTNIVGSSSKIRFIPFEESDRTVSREIYFRAPELDKVRALIGYEPQVSLAEGIEQICRSIRSSRS